MREEKNESKKVPQKSQTLAQREWTTSLTQRTFPTLRWIYRLLLRLALRLPRIFIVPHVCRNFGALETPVMSRVRRPSRLPPNQVIFLALAVQSLSSALPKSHKFAFHLVIQPLRSIKNKLVASSGSWQTRVPGHHLRCSTVWSSGLANLVCKNNSKLLLNEEYQEVLQLRLTLTLKLIAS